MEKRREESIDVDENDVDTVNSVNENEVYVRYSNCFPYLLCTSVLYRDIDIRSDAHTSCIYYIDDRELAGCIYCRVYITSLCIWLCSPDIRLAAEWDGMRVSGIQTGARPIRISRAPRIEFVYI